MPARWRTRATAPRRSTLSTVSSTRASGAFGAHDRNHPQPHRGAARRRRTGGAHADAARRHHRLARCRRGGDRAWPLDPFDFSSIAGATDRQSIATRGDTFQTTGSPPSAEELHTLRQRVVDLRYQMELIEPLWPRFGRMWTDEAERLRDRLGRCQDLEVLRRLTDPHQPLAHWRSRLTPAIAERSGDLAQRASRIAHRLFAEKPKAFRHRHGSAVGEQPLICRHVPDCRQRQPTPPRRRCLPARRNWRRRRPWRAACRASSADRRNRCRDAWCSGCPR